MNQKVASIAKRRKKAWVIYRVRECVFFEGHFKNERRESGEGFIERDEVVERLRGSRGFML